MATLSSTIFMTTESYTSTSQITTRNVRAICTNSKNNNNERLIAEKWVRLSVPEWTRQTWMGFTLGSCLMDACTLESALMQHLKWTSGSVDTTKAAQAFVTMSHKLWRDQLPAMEEPGTNPLPRACQSIDLARKTHFISILKLKNPPINLIFGLV